MAAQRSLWLAAETLPVITPHFISVLLIDKPQVVWVDALAQQRALGGQAAAYHHDTQDADTALSPPDLDTPRKHNQDSFSPDLATHTENVHCTDSAHLAKFYVLSGGYAGYGDPLREKVIDHAARREGKRARIRNSPFRLATSCVATN